MYWQESQTEQKTKLCNCRRRDTLLGASNRTNSTRTKKGQNSKWPLQTTPSCPHPAPTRSVLSAPCLTCLASHLYGRKLALSTTQRAVVTRDCRYIPLTPWSKGVSSDALNLNAEQYIHVLENSLLPPAADRFSNGFQFIQDKSSIHTAKIVNDDGLLPIPLFIK
jgi:hypothetical protein